jgi:hypothetical protein
MTLFYKRLYVKRAISGRDQEALEALVLQLSLLPLNR